MSDVPPATDKRALRQPPCVLAYEAAISIGNYCSTRFQQEVHPMLDIPWFAEKVQDALQEGADENAELRARLDAAEKRLAELATERQWRPIETAPKDGTWVLLRWTYWKPYIPVVGVWLNAEERWFSEAALSKDGPGPTHWMSLPPGPAEVTP